MAKKAIRPSAASLLQEARGEGERDAPLNLLEYADVIIELREKNLSFAQIAEWLTERLGKTVNKGGVFRAHADRLHHLEQEAAWEDEESAYHRAVYTFAEQIREFAERHAKANGLGPLILEALAKAAADAQEAVDDELAAEAADVRSKEESGVEAGGGQ